MVRQELRIVSVEDGAALAIYNADILSRSEVVLAGWSSRGNEVLFIQDRSGETYGISPLGSGQLYALPVGLQQSTTPRLSKSTCRDRLAPTSSRPIRHPFPAGAEAVARLPTNQAPDG
jgi:hypothetical protein